MAKYNYDEGGSLAAYFLITILAIILTPTTLSSVGKNPTKKRAVGCQCQPCIEHHARIERREKGSMFAPRLSKRTYFLIAGWSLFAFLCYKVSGATIEGKVYNPFEILGISASATEKEIKSHFKKLSRLYHPDKVKPTVNETIEVIQDRFVKLTKAYKALTDEAIRKNWELYGNPDGRQEMSMGIALPKWIVESHNNVWVLGFYGLLFGGALPALVGRWWFGNRQRTKDGIHARSAAAFFKSLKEESSMEEVIGTLGKAFQHEMSDAGVKKADVAIDRLESEIEKRAGSKWIEVRRIAKESDGKLHVKRRRALVLIYAHLTRIPISDPKLQKEQANILLQLPVLLSALLNVSTSRSWLVPTLAIMRFHAYLAQALPPVENQRMRLTQLPSIQNKDIESLDNVRTLIDVARVLESKKDNRVGDVKKALERWGSIELVDAAFKVIGERIVTPSSIVFLVVKLRLVPPGAPIERRELNVDETKRAIKFSDEKDDMFLNSRDEMEELDNENVVAAAHAPYWPGERKPSWWIVLADDKLNRVVVPPFKVTDVPFSDPEAEHDRDYRTYKIQFQAPQNTGMFTWKIYLVSDTFVGEDVTKDITLKIEEPQASEQLDDDEISDPDEDTLAGQMAAMRGGKVKKRTEQDEEEEESSTDDDQEDDDNSSDSDSD